MARPRSGRSVKAQRLFEELVGAGMDYRRARNRIWRDNADLRNGAILYQAEAAARVHRQSLGRAARAQTANERRAAELLGADDTDRDTTSSRGRRRYVEPKVSRDADPEDLERIDFEWESPLTGLYEEASGYIQRRENESEEAMIGRLAYAIINSGTGYQGWRTTELWNLLLDAIGGGQYERITLDD